MRRAAGSTRAWGRGAAIAAALSALLVPASAAATYDPVGAGRTAIHLSRSFTKQLHKSGVRLRAVQGARLRGRVVIFPSAAGRLDSAGGAGTIKHGGALKISRGRRSLLLKGLVLKTTARRSPLAAKVGGGQVKLASSRPIAVSRSGFGIRVAVRRMRLTTTFAVRLDHKLGLKRVFLTGQPLGTSVSQVEPQLASVAKSNRVEFSPAASFLAKMDELHVSLNPISPAELFGGSFQLPIFGGRIAPDGSAGTVVTSGSIEALQLGSGQIFWQELALEIDLGIASADSNIQPSPPYPGKVGSVPIATLAVASVAVDRSKRTVTISGSLAVGATGAAQMNQAFGQGKPVFAAGEALGTVSAVVQAE
jgi:hypothetical protein